MKAIHLKEDNFYFPSLDGLRFFAFLFVFLTHFLSRNPVPPIDNPIIYFFYKIFKYNGWVGVDLFFVLSGFLITLLLLRERSQFKNFSLKNFWIRRSLRIWPLYYLALLTGFFIIPFLSSHFLGANYTDKKFGESLEQELPLFTLFLGNWAIIIHGMSEFRNIVHLWTISIEEQFYLLWPIVLFFIKKTHKIFLATLLIIISSTFLRFFLIMNGVQNPGVYMNTFARIDSFAFGAILSLIMMYKPILFSKLLNKINLILVILMISTLFVILYFLELLYSTSIFTVTFGYTLVSLFMLFFVTASLDSKSLFNRFLSRKTFVWLGKISYGLYVWHRVGTDIGSLLTHRFIPAHFFVPVSLILSLLATILISTLSYYLLESQFLKLKKKFSKVNTRPI